MDRFYFLSHAKIDFHFKQSPRDFVVDEIPLYEFSNEGEHLVMNIRKKSLSTHELIGIIARYLGIKEKEVGYAGLKDKHALTRQYISVHKQFETKMDAFEHDQIKILSKCYHNNKIRMGHLKGNRFFIRVKKVNPVDAAKIDQALAQIKEFGMPNFFGYQRFGNDGDNHLYGEEIAKGIKKERNPKIKTFLISAYQSHLFNLWLSKRIEISRLIEGFEAKSLVDTLNLPLETVTAIKAQKHPFKMLPGDIMEHYPYGRIFEFDGTMEEVKRFEERDISPTGLLCGKNARIASDIARVYEKDFDEKIFADGARRYAWVFPTDIQGEYKPQEAWYEFHFTLPKGSYATVLLEEIAKRELSSKED